MGTKPLISTAERGDREEVEVPVDEPLYRLWPSAQRQHPRDLVQGQDPLACQGVGPLMVRLHTRGSGRVDDLVGWRAASDEIPGRPGHAQHLEQGHTSR